ncbi:MAG: imidazoleglycerol-phosphate dehydratase HisB [Fusobacteria bacterium]|nr:imidazoleglycerol-phosphate dehydratase HisB [Fusobacteriota bacterium]
MKRDIKIERKTKETEISLYFNLDGTGNTNLNTGIGFLDHMLELLAKHGDFDIECTAKGDIEVDYHHTTEDIAIVIGQAIKETLGNKIGINRYSTIHIPMMETLARVSLDLSGRGFLSFDYEFKSEKVGTFDTELVEEFFYSIAYNGGINLHIDVLKGKNVHHIIEAIFKAFARSLKEAVKITSDKLPSSKGLIQ